MKEEERGEDREDEDGDDDNGNSMMEKGYECWEEGINEINTLQQDCEVNPCNLIR